MSRTIGATTVDYVWDLSGGLPNILEDSQGNRYVYGLDLIARINGSTEEGYLADGLGSTAALTDDTGDVSDTYEYDAFGNVRAETGSSTNEFTYTGEQVDSTGLQYLRARYYDPATGRFLSQDPLPLLQRYAYVGNNPANLVDPYGLIPCPGCGAVKNAAGRAIPYPVEDFFTETIPEAAVAVGEWTYDHRYDIGQVVAGAAISASCFGAMYVCVPALIIYGTITALKYQEADGCCEKSLVVITGILGAAPGARPIGRYTGEVFASLSGGISGVGCASTASAPDSPPKE